MENLQSSIEKLDVKPEPLSPQTLPAQPLTQLPCNNPSPAQSISTHQQPQANQQPDNLVNQHYVLSDTSKFDFNGIPQFNPSGDYVPKLNRPHSSSPGSFTSDTSNFSPNNNFYSPSNSTLQSPSSVNKQISPHDIGYDNTKTHQFMPNTLENNLFNQQSFTYNNENNDNKSNIPNQFYNQKSAGNNSNSSSRNNSNNNQYGMVQDNNPYLSVDANQPNNKNNLTFNPSFFMSNKMNYHLPNTMTSQNNLTPHNLTPNSIGTSYNNIFSTNTNNNYQEKACFSLTDSSFPQCSSDQERNFDSWYLPKKPRLALEGQLI